MASLVTKPNIAFTMPGVSASGIKLLNSLTANAVWSDHTLQYYFGGDTALSLDSEFATQFHKHFSGTPDTSFAFSAVADRAFQMIDSVSQLDFNQTLGISSADQVLTSVSNPSSTTEGFFDFPGTSFHDANPTTDSWSIGAFNSGLSYMLKAPEVGGGQYANWTLLHEIGHSLGLKHTHKDTNGLPPLDTVGKFMDNERYSVMSYNDASTGKAYGHAVTYMALDVAALQALYGAEAYATGSSSYTLCDAKTGPLSLQEGFVGIGRAYYCIWDTGGLDQINYANLDKSVLINLNDATLDTSGLAADVKDLVAELKQTDFYKNLSDQLQQEIVDPWHNAGGFFSRVLDKVGHTYSATDGGFSIAHGAQIEDAVGGAKADLLLGNEGKNTLYGNSGDDVLLGSGGNDRLIADTENDLLDGGRGNDFLNGGEGHDIFVFAPRYGTDTIYDLTADDAIDLTAFHFKNSAEALKHMAADKSDHSHTLFTMEQDVLVIDSTLASINKHHDFIL